MSFQGFKPEGLQYLMEVRLRDSKQWYDEHKPLYREALLEPMRQLVLELAPVMEKIDPEIVCRPDKGISRIVRDLRFSGDKHRYRDTMWVTLQRNSVLEERPGFFFELSPVSWRYGMGFNWTSTATMQRLREAFQLRREEFLPAVEALGTRTGLVLRGAAYKKDRFPQLSEPLKSWCNQREIYIARNSTDMEALWQEDLPGKLARGFLRMKPLYEFFWSVVG